MNTQTSPKTVLNIKIDKKTKEEAQKLAKFLGLNLSQIANATYKQFVRNREFTFTEGYTMTPYLEKVIEEAERDYRTGKNISPIFTSAHKAMKWLEK